MFDVAACAGCIVLKGGDEENRVYVLSALCLVYGVDEGIDVEERICGRECAKGGLDDRPAGVLEHDEAVDGHACGRMLRRAPGALADHGLCRSPVRIYQVAQILPCLYPPPSTSPLPHSPPMPPTTALMHANPANFKAILDDIEQQFDLDQHALDVITNKFLEDFNTGLGKYGEPMAMMYVR